MRLGLEQRVTLGLQQRLVITPQLQQAIKLLQLNHVEMLEMLQEELLINPVLEVDETAPEGEPGEPSEPVAEAQSESAGEGEAAQAEGADKAPGEVQQENGTNAEAAAPEVAEVRAIRVRRSCLRRWIGMPISKTLSCRVLRLLRWGGILIPTCHHWSNGYPKRRVSVTI